MAVLKYHDGTGWEPVVSALQGPTGDAGAVYQDNEPTDTGVLWVDTDDDGFLVVPNGGATGAVLTKQSSADYDTGWDLPVNSGLVLIETQTFSAVSAVNFNNVFSADYDNYEIVYNNILTASGAAYINIRLRNAGTDDSSTNYLHQQLNVNDTAITGVRTTSQTSFLETAEFTNTFSNIAIIRIYNPFIAQPTSGYTVMARGISSGILLRNRAYGLNTTTSYDGFSAIASASTLTGSISVFGYRKS